MAILSDRDLLARASKPQALRLIEPLEERWGSEPESFEGARVRVETINKDLKWPLPVTTCARLRRLRDIAVRPSLLEFRYLIAQGRSFEALEFARAKAPVIDNAEALRLKDQIVDDLETRAAEHSTYESLVVLYRTIEDALRDRGPVALTDYFLKLGGPGPFTPAPGPSELEFSFRVRVSGCPALAESLKRGFLVSSGARRAELDINIECPEAQPERSTSNREVEEWVTEAVTVPVYDVREVVDGYYEDCQTKYRYDNYRCRYYTYDPQGNIQESESGTGEPYCGSDIIPYEECEQKPLVREEKVFTGYAQETRDVKKTRLVSEQWGRFRADLKVEITGRTENASVTIRHQDIVTTDWMENPDDRDRAESVSRAWDSQTPRLVREITGQAIERLRSSEARALSEIRKREYTTLAEAWRRRSAAMADRALAASKLEPDSLSAAELVFRAAVMLSRWPEEDSAARVSSATGIPEIQIKKIVPLWKLRR